MGMGVQVRLVRVSAEHPHLQLSRPLNLLAHLAASLACYQDLPKYMDELL